MSNGEQTKTTVSCGKTTYTDCPIFSRPMDQGRPTKISLYIQRASIFKGHSTRAASATAAVSAGEILQAADWSSEGIFQKFYYKPSKDVTAVLSTE